MPNGLLNSLRSLTDPLRSVGAAERWIASLVAADLQAIHKKTVDVVGRFVIPGQPIEPERVESLLKIDAWLEPILVQLTEDYAARYEQSSELELRLWQQGFDLIKVFAAAYQAAVRDGYPRADDKRWRALLPWVLVRLAFYKRQDGKYRLFRYSRWSLAQWREFHELYEFARTRGWQREQLVVGPATFSRPGVSLEQEYVQTLLLMRLDSGNFPADHVHWIARQLDDWTASLELVAAPGEAAMFYVELTGDQGLRRFDTPPTAGRVLYLDTNPLYTRIVERTRWLPEQEEPAQQGALPVREQRLLLTRLAALFGPDTLAIAPRAPRYPVDAEVRVVFGLAALFDALDAAAAAGAGKAGDVWRMTDASETGCRLATKQPHAPVRIGALLGIPGDTIWSIGIVRRIQRSDDGEWMLGVEIVERRPVVVHLRTVAEGGADGARPGDGSYCALYLPPRADDQRGNRRSLIGPADLLRPGSAVELDAGGGRYLIRVSELRELQSGWAWTVFHAERTLAN